MLQELHGGVVDVVVDHDVLGQFGYGVYDPLVLVKGNPVLAVVAEAHSLADVEMAAVGLHESLEHLDECGLSRSVTAYDSHFFVSGKHIV